MKINLIQFLFFTAVLFLLSSCGKSEPPPAVLGPDVPGWTLDGEEPVTLEWYVNYSWFTTQWGQNAVSKKITEETGTDIRLVSPTGNESEKLDSMLASGTLPDFVTLGCGEPQVYKMISQGLVYPLNELAERYDPYWFSAANTERLDWYRQDDGNVYGYPNSSFSVSDYEKSDRIYSNQTFLVRKDIYEAIGSPDMSAPEGFKAAIEKAAGMFPLVDGHPLIPVGAHEFTRLGCDSFDRYLMNFLAVPYEKDGEVYDRYTDPDYLLWLKTFRELGAAGYLRSDIFLDKRMQMEEKVAAGRYFCMLFQRTDIAEQQKMLYNRNPESVYIAVGGPRNARGDDHTLPGAGIAGWTLTFISKNCKHPDRAIRLMTYFMSEHGQLRTYLGVEGETFGLTEGGQPIVKPEVLNLLNTDRTEYNRLYGADNTYWMLQDNMMQLKWTPESAPPLAQPEQWTRPYVTYATQYDFTAEDGTEAGNAYKNIMEAWGETLPRLLLAGTDEAFDSIFYDFLNRRARYGFDVLTAEMTRQMKDAKLRLGLE